MPGWLRSAHTARVLATAQWKALERWHAAVRHGWSYLSAVGVLIAVAVFVPAMPLAFTLAGVLLLLAGLTAGALLTRQSRGIGWRLAVAAVLVAAVFGWYAYWDYTRNGSASTVWNLVIKAGVGILIVVLGWWLAQAKPTQAKRSPSDTSSKSSRGS